MYKVIFIAFTLPVFSGCEKQVDKLGYSHTKVVFKNPVREIISTKNDGTSTASVIIPAGVTGVDSLVISEGMAIVNDANMDDLNIQPYTSAAGIAVNVDSSKPLSDAYIGQLQLNIPIEGANRFHLKHERLAVIYLIKKQDGAIILGIIPASNFTIENGRARFNMIGLGNYQAAVLPNHVSDPREIISDLPILTRAEEKALPKLELGPIVAIWNAPAGAIDLSRTITDDHRLLTKCLALLDENRVYTWDYKSTITDPSSLAGEKLFYRFPITNTSPHTLSGRINCQDRYGRYFPSEWSTAIDITASHSEQVAKEDPLTTNPPQAPDLIDFRLATERQFYQTKSVIRLVQTDSSIWLPPSPLRIQVGATAYEFSILNDYSAALLFAADAVFLQAMFYNIQTTFSYGLNKITLSLLSTEVSNASQVSFTLKDFTLFATSGSGGGNTASEIISSNSAVSGRAKTSDGYSLSTGFVHMISH